MDFRLHFFSLWPPELVSTLSRDLVRHVVRKMLLANVFFLGAEVPRLFLVLY